MGEGPGPRFGCRIEWSLYNSAHKLVYSHTSASQPGSQANKQADTHLVAAGAGAGRPCRAPRNAWAAAGPASSPAQGSPAANPAVSMQSNEAHAFMLRAPVKPNSLVINRSTEASVQGVGLLHANIPAWWVVDAVRDK